MTTPEQTARDIVTEWLGMFDPPPQIDFQQSELLQGAIVTALRAPDTSIPAPSTLAELELLIDEYDIHNSDWGFRRGVIKELLAALRAPEAANCPRCGKPFPCGCVSFAPETGEAKPVAHLRDIAHCYGVSTVIANRDDPSAYPVYRAAPVSADAGLTELRKLYEAAAHIEHEAQNGRDYDEVEHADAIAQWQLAAWKLMPALLSQRPALQTS